VINLALEKLNSGQNEVTVMVSETKHLTWGLHCNIRTSMAK